MLALAARLRAETVMTVKWIAERLQMGAPGYVNHLLFSFTKTSRARAARCRDAPAARTVPPRAWIAQGPLELPPGESVRTIRNVGLLAGIRIARSVPLPGTAARVPTKQMRNADCRLRIDRFAKSPAVSIRPF